MAFVTMFIVPSSVSPPLPVPSPHIFIVHTLNVESTPKQKNFCRFIVLAVSVPPRYNTDVPELDFVCGSCTTIGPEAEMLGFPTKAERPMAKKKPVKKKMGRPPIPEADKSSERFGFRATAAWKDWLARFARQRREGMADVVDSALECLAEKDEFEKPPKR